MANRVAVTALALSDALSRPGDLVPSDGSVRVQSRARSFGERSWAVLWPWCFLAVGMFVLLILRGPDPWAVAAGVIVVVIYIVAIVMPKTKRLDHRDRLFLLALPHPALRILNVGHDVSTARGTIPMHPVSTSATGLVLTIVDANLHRLTTLGFRDVGVSVEVGVGPTGKVSWCVLRSPDACIKVRARGRLDLRI